MRLVTLIALLAAATFASYIVEWSAPATYSSATAYTSNRTVSYDVNGDSIPDVFLMDSSALKVYNGVSHGLLWSMPSSGYAYLSYPTIANTDGDAAKELVFQVSNYTPSYTARFYVYDCQSHALEYTSPVKSGYAYTAVADIDGDNKSEIIITNGAAGSRIMEVYGSTDLDVDEAPATAPAASVAPAFPNPACRSVLLAFPAREPGPAPVLVMDAAGRIVRHLELRTGEPALSWDCADDAGMPVPAGTYLYQCGAQIGKVEVVR
jgi:hypothetical protein